MRISEILGLTVDSFDLKNRKITVRQQLHKDIHDGTKCWLVPTKTKNVRVIYLDDLVYDAIQNELEIQEANSKKSLSYNSLNLLFTNENGLNLCITTVEKPFKRILKRLGIEGIRVHDIRHTFATTCLKNGDPINVIAANLGHNNTSTTLNVYAHYTDEMLRESAERRSQQNEKLLKNVTTKNSKKVPKTTNTKKKKIL